MAANLKRILTTSSLSPAGRAVLATRDNIDLVEFPHHLTGEDFQNLLRDLRLPKENTLFFLTPELNHTGGVAAAAADTKNGDR